MTQDEFLQGIQDTDVVGMNDRIMERIETQSVQYVNDKFHHPTEMMFWIVKNAMLIGSSIAIEEMTKAEHDENQLSDVE
jgi:hypothetical protein